MADHGGYLPGGGGPPGQPPVSAVSPTAPSRATVLGNCARCGSGERLKFCSRCNAVRYCGPECQKSDVSGRGWELG